MQDPIYDRIENTPRPTICASSALVLLAAAGLLIVGLLVPVPEQAYALLDAVYYLPFVLVPVGIYMLRRRGLSEAMRLNPMPALPALSVILLAILSVYMASALSAGWGALLDRLGLRIPTSVSIPDSPRALMLAIVTMGAVPAVCEELLFRGVVLSAWESRGTRLAVGASATLFALLHGNLYGIPAYLLVGCLSGYVVFALDSLYAGMIYHTAYNAACLVIPYLLADGTSSEVPSGSGLAVAVAVEMLMFAAMMAVLLLSLRLRSRRAGVDPIPRIRRPLQPREWLMLGLAVAAMLLITLLAAVSAGLAPELGGGM